MGSIPPVVPAVWETVSNVYDISEVSLVRAMHDTTILGASMYREFTKGIYDAIKIPFSCWYVDTAFDMLQAIQDESPGERWWRVLFPDSTYFEFMATVSELVLAPEGLTGVVRFDGVLTVSGEVVRGAI